MSFLHTLATLAQHAVQTAEAPLHNAAQAAHYGGGGMAQAVQAAGQPGQIAGPAQPQFQAPASPGGVTNYVGNHGFTPNMPGTSSLLQQLAVRQQQSPMNLGIPYGMNQTGEVLGQGGDFNPGYIPMQGSTGAQAYPQRGAYGGVQRPGDQYNPQDLGNYWYQ